MCPARTTSEPEPGFSSEFRCPAPGPLSHRRWSERRATSGSSTTLGRVALPTDLWHPLRPWPNTLGPRPRSFKPSELIVGTRRSSERRFSCDPAPSLLRADSVLGIRRCQSSTVENRVHRVLTAVCGQRPCSFKDGDVTPTTSVPPAYRPLSRAAAHRLGRYGKRVRGLRSQAGPHCRARAAPSRGAGSRTLVRIVCPMKVVDDVGGVGQRASRQRSSRAQAPASTSRSRRPVRPKARSAAPPHSRAAGTRA